MLLRGPRLVVALLELRHHPMVELSTPHQLQPVVHPTPLGRSPHHYAWQKHVHVLPQQREPLLQAASHPATLDPDSVPPQRHLLPATARIKSSM